MKAPKKALTLGLMISSLLLLIVLQSLWLKNSYESAYLDLGRESSMLFRSTVITLRDSLFVQNIETVDGDSIGMPPLRHMRDSMQTKYLHGDTTKNIRILITSNERLDSGVNFLKPLASSLHRLERRQSFFIRIGPDTLSIAALTKHYRKNLMLANILLPFAVKHAVIKEKIDRSPEAMLLGRWYDVDEPREQRPYNDSLTTAWVNLNPMNAYAVVFPEIRGALLKKIAPQILFSFFLTLVIMISFATMYRSLRDQEVLNIAKNDFINNITHELKTPIATVSVALEALKSFQVLANPERTTEYMDIAQTELDRLTLMTDKILKSSSFETNGISFVKEKVNMDKLIRKVVAALRLSFEKQNIHIKFEVDGSNFEVQGNEMHLTSVVYNLIDNAMKYGGPNGRLDLTLRGFDTRLEFTVQDYGIGIPARYQSKIFDKFFRVPTGDVHNVKGYGLGLNYASNFVKMLGGKIEVESEVGKGSSFKITLFK